jgi:trehalose 6-phosphate phosphatase
VNGPDLPSALQCLTKIEAAIGRRTPAFFVDFDGTLVPLAARPELVEVPSETVAVLSSLAESSPVCVISGRDSAYLRDTIGLECLYYAADHGHRITGPPGSGVILDVGPEDRDQLQTAIRELESRLREVKGATLEPKDVSVAVHYRLVAEDQRPHVRQVVDDIVAKAPGLKVTEGKLVRELMPDLHWSKGKAVTWLLERLRVDQHDLCPVCLGDDLTDEDMFGVARRRGVTVLVGDHGRPTKAEYGLRDPSEVARFLKTFVTRRPESPTASVD